MKLVSTKYSAGAFNFAMLFLRVGLGVLMAKHGFDKITNFNDILHGAHPFKSMIGLGPKVELSMLIFAEFFCSVFLVLGLFTRLLTLPLIFAMCIALFKTHDAKIFGDGEHAALYIIGFVVLLILGPGKISVDGATGK